MTLSLRLFVRRLLVKDNSSPVSSTPFSFFSQLSHNLFPFSVNSITSSYLLPMTVTYFESWSFLPSVLYLVPFYFFVWLFFLLLPLSTAPTPLTILIIIDTFPFFISFSFDCFIGFPLRTKTDPFLYVFRLLQNKTRTILK